MNKILNSQVGRRCLVAGAGYLAVSLSGASAAAAQGASDASPSAFPVATELLPELVIDLAGDLVSIDPALAYAPRDWSIRALHLRWADHDRGGWRNPTPAQLAVWHMLLPSDYTRESLASNSFGSGSYTLISWEKGSHIVLERFPGYQPTEAKGVPIAERVVYRFVPEASTRVADLLSGSAEIVAELPLDQQAAVESGGAAVVSTPIVGSIWIRVATDTAPFDDPRVRQGECRSLMANRRTIRSGISM